MSARPMCIDGALLCNVEYANSLLLGIYLYSYRKGSSGSHSCLRGQRFLASLGALCGPLSGSVLGLTDWLARLDSDFFIGQLSKA